MRVGLLGGTFDPPHIAHLLLAENSYRQLGLDEVWMVPAGNPWQKPPTSVSPSRHRWAMTEAAVRRVPYLKADDRELIRTGPTYTVDTVSTIPDADITLILGADAAAGIGSWHRSDDLLATVSVAVAPRPGYEPHHVESAAGADLIWLDVPYLDVSSTGLRKRAESGQSLRFLVPEPVHSYIEHHGLYR